MYRVMNTVVSVMKSFYTTVKQVQHPY